MGGPSPSKRKKPRTTNEKNPNYPPAQYTTFVYRIALEWYERMSTKDLDKRYLRHTKASIEKLSGGDPIPHFRIPQTFAFTRYGVFEHSWLQLTAKLRVGVPLIRQVADRATMNIRNDWSELQLRENRIVPNGSSDRGTEVKSTMPSTK